MPRILVVDDEPRYCQILEAMLRHEDYEVATTTDGKQAARLLDEQEFDLVISDLRMSQYDGMDLLRHRNVVAPEVPFIVLTAFGTIPSAVEMVREGALDYLTKPFKEEIILATVRNSLKIRALAEENRSLRELLKESLGETVFLGDSPPIKALSDRIKRVAPTDLTVLILGETGTGKDLLALMIHGLSSHKDGPFVKVNCAAIPTNLLESELFGYERGAFSGATNRHKGKFQIAHGGTLFLDEVGELDLILQAKILQAIEEKRFYPLGGSQIVEVNCRILAASNRPLEEMVREGRFRQDLFHRLMAFPLRIPPLRERKEDIKILSEYYLQVFGAEMKKNGLKLEPRALDFLTKSDWKGNVRELMNVLRSAVLMSRGGTIGPESLLSHPIFWEESETEEQQTSGSTDSIPIPTLAQSERELIKRALQLSGGNKSQAARLLGISRSHLRYRMMVHDL
ncbi:MAG: sigma-54 dependent transcriptional regulator [Thermodesulfobacteriota bacterium]